VKKKPTKVGEAPAPYAAKKPVKAAKSHRQFTAIVRRENDGFVAQCPELDVASQGNTVKSARANLAEAVALFLEAAFPAEIAQRLRSETYVTKLEVAFG
jgi:predicted RNase H-like HicB family nuclease